MKKKSVILLIIVMLGMLGMLAGYRNTGKNISQEVKNQESKTTVLSDYPVVQNFSEMIGASDIIVVGKYTEYKESMNMARDINDVTKEDSGRNVEGKIYNFEVSKYLYGTGKDNIDIIFLYKNDGIIDETFYEPALNEKAVLCLKYTESFDQYYAAIYPFEITVGKNDDLKVKTNIELISDSLEEFTSKYDDFIKEVDKIKAEK